MSISMATIHGLLTGKSEVFDIDTNIPLTSNEIGFVLTVLRDNTSDKVTEYYLNLLLKRLGS